MWILLLQYFNGNLLEERATTFNQRLIWNTVVKNPSIKKKLNAICGFIVLFCTVCSTILLSSLLLTSVFLKPRSWRLGQCFMWHVPSWMGDGNQFATPSNGGAVPIPNTWASTSVSSGESKLLLEQSPFLSLFHSMVPSTRLWLDAEDKCMILGPEVVPTMA